MLRAALVALTFCVTSFALAADPLPKDITAEARAEFIKKWQPAYAAERDKHQAKLEEGKSLAKFKATEKDGKKLIADATTALKNLEARPGLVPDSPVEVIGEKEPTAGAVCHPATFDNSFVVKEVLSEGTLVECAIPRNGKTTVTNYVIASPVEVPKKKDAGVKWSGLWYAAGTVEVKGKKVPVLYKFDLKKDDYPPAKK